MKPKGLDVTVHTGYVKEPDLTRENIEDRYDHHPNDEEPVADEEDGAVMNQREAKRQAWMAAWWILTSGPVPTSPPNPEGVCESELSAQNFARWAKAWEEVCYSVGLKGGRL
jgi:hypothetical protein